MSCFHFKKICFLLGVLVLISNISLTSAIANVNKKNALVIGNSRYKVGPLSNPTNDAHDMGRLLKDLGFNVLLLIDGNKRQMEEAIRQFGRTLIDNRAVGLFYYAGHAMEIDNENYLLPVDIVAHSISDVKYGSINANRVLGEMDDAGNEINIVLLDSCRDNPFIRKFRSSRKGLAEMDAPPGTFIGFATSPGKIALDGNGRNGIFTHYLMKQLDTPGLLIDQVMNRTRRAVIQDTKGQQVPWQQSSLSTDFKFIDSEQKKQQDVDHNAIPVATKINQDVVSKKRSGNRDEALSGGSQKIPIIAILDFDVFSNCYEKLGRQTAELMTDAIVNAGLFDVVERDKLKAILNEQKLGVSGFIDIESAIALGEMLPAQYILVGKIISAGVSEKTFTGYGIETTKTTAFIKISASVIDTRTGKIAFSGIESASSSSQSTPYLKGEAPSLVGIAERASNKLVSRMITSRKFSPTE